MVVNINAVPIMVLASFVLVDAQVCVFLAAWQRTWWEGDSNLTELTAASPGVVHMTTNFVTKETLTCQNLFEATDQWRYFVGSSNLNAPNHQCKRVYHDTNLLVFMTGAYSGSTTQFDASVCAEHKLYENTSEAHILVDDTPTDLGCFTSLVGSYIATYSTSTTDQAQQGLCSNATATSRVYITDRTIVMNTCATGTALGLIRGNKTLRCFGRIPGTYIGQPAGSELVALSDDSRNKEYYCSRIRFDTASQRVFLSIDTIASGTNGLRCTKAVSAETAQPSPDLFVALVLERFYCEPSHGCLNGATCVEPVNPVGLNPESYTCTCLPSYTGNRCQTFIWCSVPTRCRDVTRGTCTEDPVNNFYTCTCNNGFTGQNCETELICVTRNPCLNGAICNEATGYVATCTCPNSFTGKRCETRLLCVPNPGYCQNGGTCSEAPGDVAMCACRNGYTGDRCETALVCVLQSTYCQNGATCVVGPGYTATCSCPVGFTGDRCQTRLICVLQSPYCLNGGACIEGPGDNASCNCLHGYTGDRCETALICVLRSPYCQNGGTCVELPGDAASCTCPAGFTGDRCQTQLICVTRGPYCQNGGTCNETAGDTATCICPINYVGDRCQTPLFCVPDPCKNGGTCNENTDTCKCPANYRGDFCETYLYCSSNPCQNNQQCTEGIYTFICNCTYPYVGVQCELEIRCQFPTRWLGTWFLNPTFALNFAVNQMYELPSPTATPVIATNTFNCVRYKESALTQGVRYFARSNVRDIHTETCTKGFQTTHLFLHWEDQSIQDATPLTAEHCENNANFSFMPDIYVKYPFDYSTGSCLEFAAGQYEVVYSRNRSSQGLCANNPASIAVISPNSIQFTVCPAGGVEVILQQTLDCVGRISSIVIDPATEEIIVFQVRGISSQVRSFYCGRIRQDLNNRRLLLSLDLTLTYSQITCLAGISTTTAIDSPTLQIRAFNLKRVYCFPLPCLNGGTCVEHDGDEFTCTCAAGYTGQLCETGLFCVPGQCRNGGTCTELSGTGYRCTCPATPITFNGTNCETRLFCTPTSPCLNGGTCSERPGIAPSYICTCPLGFSGDNCAVEGDCAFPSSWIGNWYVQVNQYVEFRTNNIYYKSSPSGTPQSSYHCEDFYASAGVGDWWFYVRSPLAAPTNETCFRVYRDNNVLIHFDGFNGTASDTPTAEQCEGTGSMANYPRTPAIMIRHPFDFTTTSCFAQYTGQYFAQVSTLCGNSSTDMYTSKVTIADSSLKVDTCRKVRTEPLSNTRLMCVGLIDARYIGDDLTDPVIILAKYDAPAPTGTPDNFFCARIRNSLDDRSDPRIYLSIDITPRPAIECLEGYTAVSTSPSSPTIRALELTPVFCQPSDPCLNGGTCREMNGLGHECICLSFFTGRNCETGSGGCASDPCLNNGNCTTLNMMGDYQCTCPARFTGDNCETEIFCTGVLCQNGGTCTEQTGNYECRCVAGYTERHCETDINECASNPCQNVGTCNNMVNSYTCTCVGGTSGVNCATLDGCFSNPCMNGATCRTTNTNGGYECTCVPGHTGSRCETDINECASSPCVNGGTCLNRINSYECQCPSGYSGSTCQYINGCRSTPCQNRGTCTYNITSTRDTYACECTFEYTGTNCESRLWCAGVMCLNGGTCQAVTNNYTCLCAEDYVGRHCGEPVVAEEEDEGFHWSIFAIVVGVISGLIALVCLKLPDLLLPRMGMGEPTKYQGTI